MAGASRSWPGLRPHAARHQTAPDSTSCPQISPSRMAAVWRFARPCPAGGAITPHVVRFAPEPARLSFPNWTAMPSHFSCTMCGRCCRDLRLPLSLAEAAGWLRDGGETQLLCDAIPWPVEPAADDRLAAYKFRRSFPAMSGTLPLRVIVTVVAAFDGPCPHLQADLRCGAYDRRPRVCRIYPAEINPFIELQPAAKLCPPEAWDERHPVLEVAGRYADPSLVATIELSARPISTTSGLNANSATCWACARRRWRTRALW